jgi:hypothetical protein
MKALQSALFVLWTARWNDCTKRAEQLAANSRQRNERPDSFSAIQQGSCCGVLSH